MMTPMSFTKDAKQQNILLDEYFSEHQAIEVIAFNYDGAGTALCRCDGELAEIEKANLHKLIFGAKKAAVEAYLQCVFDPDTDTDDIRRQNGEPVFRLPALRHMKKYDVANLAKQTLKEVQALTANLIHYYVRNEQAPVDGKGHPAQ